ncbi:MAG: alpha/beta fold hydrolase [Acidimicrobiales bacterium]|jgi:pimeloyl-ACP methyl ester carboxylesterase
MVRGHSGREAGPRRPGITLVLAALAALALVAATGCSGAPGVVDSSSAAPAAPTAPAAPPPSSVTWVPCSGDAALQCGSVSVPVDYRHPRGATLTIALTEAPALDPPRRIGTLVFNPGGPGESGNQILPVVLPLFPASVRQRFDIVSFDPRGTGASHALDCGTSPSTVAALSPVPAAAGQPLPGTGVFTAMARACQSLAPGLEPFLDSTDTARDLDRIRQALGLATINYYGVSYGTVLGSVYAELFPHRVRAMVLDGAVDINASLVRQAEEQAPAGEASTVHLLSTCGGVAPCPLGADPTASFEALAASLARRPLPAPGGGDDTPVTVGDLDTATLFAVTVPEDTDGYLDALVAAEHGDGAPLRNQALGVLTDIDGASLVDPLWAITCNDAADHPGPVAAGTLARALAARYPLLGGYSATYALGGCVAWPAARQPVTDVRPVGAPPTLVIGNTGDPNTPIVAARHLAAVFPTAVQLTWQGWGHTWLLSGAGDTCMQRWVSGYLEGNGLPPRGTVCR